MGKVNSHSYFIVQLQKIRKESWDPQHPMPNLAPLSIDSVDLGTILL